jgi:hypothetical protein
MNPLIRSDKATMPFIARNYDKNPAAPLDKDKWVDDGKGNELGQCVSLVKFLIPELRGVGASHGWTKGLPAFGNGAVQPGTAIATFNAAGHYFRSCGDLRVPGCRRHDGDRPVGNATGQGNWQPPAEGRSKAHRKKQCEKLLRR